MKKATCKVAHVCSEPFSLEDFERGGPLSVTMTTNDKHCQTSVKSDFYDAHDYSAMYDETIPVVNSREIESPPSSRSSDEEVVRANMSKFNPPVRHTARHDFDSESESDSEPEKFLNIDSVEDEVSFLYFKLFLRILIRF